MIKNPFEKVPSPGDTSGDEEQGKERVENVEKAEEMAYGMKGLKTLAEKAKEGGMQDLAEEMEKLAEGKATEIGEKWEEEKSETEKQIKDTMKKIALMLKEGRIEDDEVAVSLPGNEKAYEEIKRILEIEAGQGEKISELRDSKNDEIVETTFATSVEGLGYKVKNLNRMSDTELDRLIREPKDEFGFDDKKDMKYRDIVNLGPRLESLIAIHERKTEVDKL